MWCNNSFKNYTHNEMYCMATNKPCECKDAPDAEQRKCYERRSLCGFLAPDGTYYFCEYFGHLDKALQIVTSLNEKNTSMNALDAENHLLNSGWVALYCRRAGFLSYGYLPIRRHENNENGKTKIRLLTEEQVAFLEDALNYCVIEDKRNDIARILFDDYKLKNDPAYRKMMEETADETGSNSRPDVQRVSS